MTSPNPMTVARRVLRSRNLEDTIGVSSGGCGPFEDSETARKANPFRTRLILDGVAPEPPRLLVDNLVLDGDINLWAGHGGSAKSTLLLHLALCVALGRPFAGSLKVQRTGTVLLVLPEDGEAWARMTLDALVATEQLSEVEKAHVTARVVMVEDSEAVNLTRDASRICDTAIECGAVLVILDPLRNLLGGAEETSNDVAGVTIDTLRRSVCREAGAAVVISHHNRKPGKDSLSDGPSVFDVRSAGGWANGARLVFAVTKKSGSSEITLDAVKSNRIPSGLKHHLKLTVTSNPENNAQWYTCAVTDANKGAQSIDLTAGIGRPINDNERKALSVLDDTHEPGKTLGSSTWQKNSDINANTLDSIRKRLLDAGMVKAVVRGRNRNGQSATYSYGITPEGKHALESGWIRTPAGFRGEGVTKP